MPKIVKNIQRADAAVIKTLGELGVATVHEAQGRTGLLRPYMRPIYPTAKAAGSAVTVSCAPGDNLMIHAAVEWLRPGDILVVTTTSESTDGMFGVLPRANAADVVKAASDRFAKESKTRERLKNGELGLDFYGLRAKLAELGVKYVDHEGD